MNQLHEMHLSYLAKDIRERIEDKSFMELSFEDQLTTLVDREWHRRKKQKDNGSYTRRIILLQKRLGHRH